jgi:sugar phosphate isomerase/epimerase
VTAAPTGRPASEAKGDGPLREAIFWAGSLGSRSLPSLLAAAQSGDFRYMAMSPQTVSLAFASGLTAEDILLQARAVAVEIVELDGVSTWAPAPLPRDAPSELHARFDFSALHSLDLASALGMTRVVIVGVFEPGAVATADLVFAFGSFCDAASARGIAVELEFIPYWGIRTLAEAWEIVSRANRPNAGLLIDTWHLIMGSVDLEADLRLLAEIPPVSVTGLQLADARRPESGTKLGSLGRLRRLPGQGDLPIDRILDVIARHHPAVLVGTEIFGHSIDDLSDEDAGIACGRATRSAMDYMSRLNPAS